MATGRSIPTATNPIEQDLLGRLGLDERATSEDIARTRDELQAFLAGAPRSLRSWARAQATAADEAFVLLSDPTSWDGAGALPAPRPRSVSRPGGSATPPVRRAISPVAAEVGPDQTPPADGDTSFEEMLAELTPSMHRDRIGAHSTAAAPAPAARFGRPVVRKDRRLSRVMVGVVAVAAIALAGFALYQSGAAPVTAIPSAAPVASAGIDEARVAELMGVIQANPKDTAALLELGDAFFKAADYTSAQTWLQKLIALEPNNVRGLLALGASQFNLGNPTDAMTNWQNVVKLDSNNVEAHYDLGFLYLNQAPPDLEGVKREWNEVVRLAPGTDIAKVVQQHLDAFAKSSAAPAGSGAPTTAPAAGSSVAPTVAPSAAPTGSVAP